MNSFMLYADDPDGNANDGQKNVLVMGPTGSGKTTFINLLTGANSGVNTSLQSCTCNIKASPTVHLGRYKITIFDTPGFDDTTKSDVEILRMVASFLETNYQQKKKLDGILYMQRMTDVRMGGISRRNFGMIRKLCGDDTLKNVAIILNMWDAVKAEIAESRANELANEEIFFKDAIAKGARMLRHTSTVESASSILHQIISQNSPVALRFQKELLDEKMDVPQTAAALELQEELQEQVARHQREMHALKEETRLQLATIDEKCSSELFRSRAQQSTLIEMSLEAEARYNEEKSRRDQEIQDRMERTRLQAEQAEIEIQALQDQLAATNTSTKKELEQMRNKLLDLECRVRLKHG